MFKRAYKMRNMYIRLKSMKPNLLFPLLFGMRFLIYMIVGTLNYGPLFRFTFVIMNDKSTQYSNRFEEKNTGRYMGIKQQTVASRSIFHLNGTEFKSVLKSGIRMK